MQVSPAPSEVLVSAGRVEFAWQPYPQATDYRIMIRKIRDAAGNMDSQHFFADFEVQSDGRLAGDAPSLARGSHNLEAYAYAQDGQLIVESGQSYFTTR